MLLRIEVNMQMFGDKWTKRFLKACHFLKILETLYYRTFTEKLVLILLISLPESKTLCFFSFITEATFG